MKAPGRELKCGYFLVWLGNGNKRGRLGHTTGHFGIGAIQLALNVGVKVEVALRYAVDVAISCRECHRHYPQW